MIEPIRIEFEVACSAENAFRTSTTLVEIEHRGWERLGAGAQSWRDQNRGGWDGVLPQYRDAANRPRTFVA